MATLSEAAATLEPGAAELIELGQAIARGVADIRGHLELGGADSTVDIAAEFQAARAALANTRAAVRAIKVRVATAINA